MREPKTPRRGSEPPSNDGHSSSEEDESSDGGVEEESAAAAVAEKNEDDQAQTVETDMDMFDNEDDHVSQSLLVRASPLSKTAVGGGTISPQRAATAKDSSSEEEARLVIVETRQDGGKNDGVNST